MIAEDGPDDLVFDLLLLDPDDDLDDVSPSSDGRVPVLLTESSQSSFGRNEEHVSFLFQIGSAKWNSPVLFGESSFDRASRLAMIQNIRALSNGAVGRKLLKKCSGSDSVASLGLGGSCLVSNRLFLFLWPISGIKLRENGLLLSLGSGLLLKRIQSMSLSSDWLKKGLSVVFAIVADCMPLLHFRV